MTKKPMKALLTSVKRALYDLAAIERIFIPGQYMEMAQFVGEIQIGDRRMRVIVVEADLDDEASGANDPGDEHPWRPTVIEGGKS